jgi:hypothetical protein
MSELELKQFGSLEIKDASLGEVEAIVATLGVVDNDGDVILPGAVPVNGATVKLSGYAHDVVLDGAAPVGIGTVVEENGRLLFKGRFFMSTERGREAFHTTKELGADGEWSFGFPNGSVKTAKLTDDWRTKGARRIIATMHPIEASPVFQGAGIGTGTLAVKEAVKEGVKEAVAEVSEEAAEKVEEAQQAEQVEAAKQAEEQAEAERKAAEEAEAKQKEQDAALKQATLDAMDEYHRVQRTLKRLGVVG